MYTNLLKDRRIKLGMEKLRVSREIVKERIRVSVILDRTVREEFWKRSLLRNKSRFHLYMLTTYSRINIK